MTENRQADCVHSLGGVALNSMGLFSAIMCRTDPEIPLTDKATAVKDFVQKPFRLPRTLYPSSGIYTLTSLRRFIAYNKIKAEFFDILSLFLAFLLQISYTITT